MNALYHPSRVRKLAAGRTANRSGATPSVTGRPRLLGLLVAALAALALVALCLPLTASAASSARFRVVVTGYDVKSPTWDHWWQVDGKCDEVYISTIANRMKKSGEGIYGGERTSKTMGDVNGHPGRVQAGSCSDQGGLGRDDSFPHSNPWIETTPPSLSRNYPSMTVWEGDLVQGEDVVLVSPSIWEWDGGQDAFGDWVTWGQQAVSATRGKFEALIGPGSKVLFDAAELGLGLAVSMKESGLLGNASDRPIGMTLQEGSSTYEFKPQVIALNYDSAARIAQDQPAGLGLGVLSLRYLDSSKLWGDYQLYVRVEKVHDNPPVDTTPVPTPTTPTPTPDPVEPEPIESPVCRSKPWMCMD